MKINKKLRRRIVLSSFLALLCFIVLKFPIQAAFENPVIGDLGTIDGAKDGSKFIDYMVYLWRVSINLGSLTVIIYFLLGAFEWISSGGDKTKIEGARNKITNAVIGLVILVSSFVLINFLSKILFRGEFNILELTFPTRTERNAINTSTPTDKTPQGIQPIGQNETESAGSNRIDTGYY